MSVVSATSEHAVREIEGRVQRIASVLSEKQIHLLTAGALEHYLPSYQGNIFRMDEAQKRKAVENEILFLSGKTAETDLSTRYGQLMKAIRGLPSKADVDVDGTLIDYLAKYIIEVQTLIVKHAEWGATELNEALGRSVNNMQQLFSIKSLRRGREREFYGSILIKSLFREAEREVPISHLTNAGMRNFEIQR